MKIALIGTGKTGQKLQEKGILAEGDHILPFNSQHPPTLMELKQSDVIVVFVPGTAAPHLLPLLKESQLPCVWGSTGFIWPDDLNATLIEKKMSWIHSNNFSLGMSIIRKLLGELKKTMSLYSSLPQLHMVETHHLQKKDAPSGTALSWREWLGLDFSIESKREGDVVGLHELTLDTGREIIALKHEAKDRGIFAEGAYLAAKVLYEKKLSPGLHSFDKVTDLIFQNKIQLKKYN